MIDGLGKWRRTGRERERIWGSCHELLNITLSSNVDDGVMGAVGGELVKADGCMVGCLLF